MSPAHKHARRLQILDGARKCFARQGYQSTTIRQIETQTGLSSGAIFNYFPTKADIFLALAEADAREIADQWTAGGLRAVVTAAAETGTRYRARYLEVGRELLTDSDFRRRWERRGETVISAIHDYLKEGREAGTIRSDLSLDELVTYSVVHLDGLGLQLRLGAPIEELLFVIDLYEATIRPAHSVPWRRIER